MPTDNFQWTDELVAEYSLTNQKMTLGEFKRFVTERQQWQHDKQPLFKREDGIDIYEVDNVYPVAKIDFSYREMPVGKFLKEYHKDMYHVFSTETQAKQYILYNKPCLSLVDIVKFMGGGSEMFQQIKRLVEQKINNTK